MKSLLDWADQRDNAMSRVEKNANKSLSDFSKRAGEFITNYLKEHGETSGEDLTDACKAAGLVPHDDRAFGPVYHRLAKNGVIEKAGSCIRKRGHGTSGGTIWRLKTC